ncbi:uncharacterized protein BYT42DRAFT_577411 [Radiomyces spectabilis]|uniref:uncharacterized protein n=1 Tax=Radiomyces spectabilis TaxID=64574 RepID=UPI00221FDCC7|nr:uncharacterized protein BYT42DRAFT_577411 [Radiomyces spectabilis]KAI8374724.1 hypothetical protein BYT42DRAFT_577411 [Radiomyces spectabilis]
MSSGVAVNDKCLETFQELKLRKKYTYIMYKLSDDNTEIVIDKTAESASYDDLLNEVPENEPRYIVFDFEFEKSGEGMRNKIVFINWTPDSARIKSKMLYASSKDAIRRSLVGIAVEAQATDMAEIAYESILEKVDRK